MHEPKCIPIPNKFFEQTEGTEMGNPLSPFLAEVFASRFEINIKNTNNDFPKIWVRYVDDIFEWIFFGFFN